MEIGTEELPAAYLDGTIEELRQETERLVRDAHLEFAAVETVGTPRRLVLVIRALRRTQHNPPEEIRGPSKQAAFDPGGKPTGALTGFLRARGGTVSQTKIVRTEKGDYVYLLKPARQIPTVQVLPQLIEQVIGRLHFPKTMRWDDSAARFARPIRWLLVLYGSKPLGVSVGRLKSGRRTWVGGPKHPKAVSVATTSQYLTGLKRMGILLDQRQRRSRIHHLVQMSAKHSRGIPVPEIMTHGLLDEVTHLVEQPVALMGQFDPRYLALPREVLLASMAKYQRVFAMQASSGKLLPKFVAILDGAPRKLAGVRQMYEHILNARLADSLFFWEQDQKTPLRSADLSGVVIHEKLGSMADKTGRMLHMIPQLAQAWQLSSTERQLLERACTLAKCDLVTTMVKEFPTLQGIMGKHYAVRDGEPREVAEAIEEHYLPLAGRHPNTLLGRALAVLDKYDTLASYFTIGIQPTGDQDPFGLRRAAQGIVEVVWLVRRALPFDALFTPWQAAAVRFAHGKAHIAEQIRTYLLERLYTFDWPKPVPSRDVIDAVRASRPDDLVDTMHRVVTLTGLNDNRTLLKAAKVIERTHNILKAAPQEAKGQIDPTKFQDELERRLWTLIEAQKPSLEDLINQRKYAEVTIRYGELFFDPLHEFFAKVMVNVEDTAIQQNRLALMRAINVLYTDHVADLSQLAILQRTDPIPSSDPRRRMKGSAHPSERGVR